MLVWRDKENIVLVLFKDIVSTENDIRREIKWENGHDLLVDKGMEESNCRLSQGTEGQNRRSLEPGTIQATAVSKFFHTYCLLSRPC
jgi:hypothetical protein